MNYLVIPDSFWSALGYIGTVLLLVAGAIIAQAIWGGRRSWMPTCRKCGYDLRGVAADTSTCPECGADLSRPGAVPTGRVRVRPVLLGFGVMLGVLAGFLVWYLQPERIEAMRARLIASTPLDLLIESVLGGGSGDELALKSLDARSGFGGRTRTIPSGELLDGFVAAIARHDESKRGPIGARLPKLQMVASALDRDECTRLAQLVVDQLVASDGADRRLLGLALLAQQSGGSATSGLRSAIRERLKQSDDGRRFLLPAPPAAAVAASRRALELEFSTMLSDMDAAGRSAVLDDSGRFVLERAEYLPSGTGAAIEFRSLPLPDGSASDEVESRVRLLVDAPAGKGRLVLTGVVVPSGAIRMDVPLTLQSARDLPGAIPHTMETVLEVQAPRIFKPQLVTDEAVLDAVALSCGNATFGGGASESLRLQVDIFPRNGQSAGVRPRNYSFDVLIVQDGSTRRMGSLMGGARSRSIAGGSMPKAVDTTRPFEIVLRPDLARVAMLDENDARMMSGEFVWAEFRLKFPSSILPPKVEWAALPTGRPTLEPIEEATGEIAEGGTLEQRLQRLAAMLVPLRLGDGAPASPEPGLAIAATDAEAATLARSLPLCGILEVLSDGALIAPERVVIGSMLDDGSSSYRLPSDLGHAPTIVVRYTPDPDLAMPTAEGTMRFVALPFELVYEGGKAPELRVLPKPAP
ncbi:MAG: zinc ribbon domain-containing protein [Planctomycetaceae bacterium]|nr:zinc ribbon domain-containing protein [Planctomycetaceae bacterium]